MKLGILGAKIISKSLEYNEIITKLNLCIFPIKKAY